MATTDLYVCSVVTENRDPTDVIDARLEPFYGERAAGRHKVERWEPGEIFAVLPIDVQRFTSRGGDVVFGVSDGKKMYMTAYVSQTGTRKNLAVYRDGGSMSVTFGVATVPGPATLHFFAIGGPDLVTPAMMASTKNMVRLTNEQVHHVFRWQPPSVLRFFLVEPTPESQRAVTNAYVRSVVTEENRTPTDKIHARLDPLHGGGAGYKVERWEPGKIFAVLRIDRRRIQSHTGDVVFGVSDGDNVYITGFVLSTVERRNIQEYDEGGDRTMEASIGVPTVPGPTTTHFFALLGPNLVTRAMMASRKKFIKLTHPQVLYVFRTQPASVLRHIASTHARDRAMATLRRVRSRRRSA